jgi:Lipase maturation factor
MKHHLLTLPMPTNLAFYFYYLPDGYLKLTTVFVHLSELLCPWLFFAPVRSIRIFAFYWQLFLQVCIIATGNYGFINFLVIAMLLSLLDDSHFHSSDSTGGINYKKVFSFILTLGAVFLIVLLTITFYQVTWTDGVVDATIRKFTSVKLKESFFTYRFF